MDSGAIGKPRLHDVDRSQGALRRGQPDTISKHDLDYQFVEIVGIVGVITAAKVRIPVIATGCSGASRPSVPIDRDQLEGGGFSAAGWLR